MAVHPHRTTSQGSATSMMDFRQQYIVTGFKSRPTDLQNSRYMGIRWRDIKTVAAALFVLSCLVAWRHTCLPHQPTGSQRVLRAKLLTVTGADEHSGLASKAFAAGAGSNSSSSSSSNSNSSGSDSSGVLQGQQSDSSFASSFSSGFSSGGFSNVPDPSSLPQMPSDFDWKAYLQNHPELLEKGIDSEAKAAHHWLKYGQQAGHVYKRIPVLMQYTACGGLSNQLYSHIAALTLAANIGAELILPPALTRSSFAHYFSMFKERNEVTWSAVPLSSLIDVDTYIAYWKQRGLRVHKTPRVLRFPDMSTPEVAYIEYDMPGINTNSLIQLRDVYQQQLPLSELVQRARQAVVGHAETLHRSNPAEAVNHIVLDLPCTFFMLSGLSDMDIPREAALSMHFAPEIVQLGEKVINGISQGGSAAFGTYNGIHLRLESDSRDWANTLGGMEGFWQTYVDAIKQADFDTSLALYTATGLLSYGANEQMVTTMQKLTADGWTRKVVYKEMYLTKEDEEGLSSEQKALVDFVVLLKAQRVVGLSSSTFSYYLREYRALTGYEKSDTVLADASRIGTDDMFATCGTLLPEA